MKVIIAGSRTIFDFSLLEEAVKNAAFDITQVVSGRARGVDQMGELWALKNGVNLKTFPAKWQTFGKVAGILRNRTMAEYADALIALMVQGGSSGTENMIHEMAKRGKPYYLMLCESPIIEPSTRIGALPSRVSDPDLKQGELW